MPKPYSQDLRERVVRTVEAGVSCREAAAIFEVSPSSAIKWVARWRRTGSVAAKPMGGKRSPLDARRRSAGMQRYRSRIKRRMPQSGRVLRITVGSRRLIAAARRS
jgi:transposase